MHPAFLTRGAAPAVPITFVTAASWPQQRAQLDARALAYADAAGFEPKASRHLLLPGPDGVIAGVLFGLESADDPLKDTFRPGALATVLPAGVYRFANCAARSAARRARDRARHLPLHPLPQVRGQGRPARVAGGRRWR